jgi:alanine racemase
MILGMRGVSDVHPFEGCLSDAEATAARVLHPRRAAPADALRPTRAEINLDNLRHNLRAIERAVRVESSSPAPAIWGVLKADAYGHGAPAVARTLERAGIGGVCVALLEEAIELRAAGIRLPILVMGGLYGTRRDGLDEIIANDLVPVVYDVAQVERIARFARVEAQREICVHLKVDTGMARLGVSSGDLNDVLTALAAHRELRLEGLMTHFACADAPDLSTTREQVRAFRRVHDHARREHGLVPRLCHAANSAGLLRLPDARFDVVRPGLALFGISPFTTAGDGDPTQGLAVDLRPVMRVRTEVIALRTVACGQAIGYDHTWRAERSSAIATVPIGYADGLDRVLSNRGHALIHGRRVPIAGTVSMDLTMIDVSDIPGAKIGDEVVFLGAQQGPLGHDAIGAQEIARHTGSIPWNVLTSISRRVPRFYREP